MSIITIFILAAFFTFSFVQSFIIGTNKGFRKCYYSDVAPEKTLDVRFGIPRREKQDCKFKLTVDYQSQNGYTSEGEPERQIQGSYDHSLYEYVFDCFKLSPMQPIVYKHTPEDIQYSGRYRICMQNVFDNNPQNNSTMFFLTIAQKFDPTLMLQVTSAPLVQSVDILELDNLVSSIRKIISWCEYRIKYAENGGDSLTKAIQQIESTNKNITIFQIVLLIVYGVVWVLALGLTK